jgi:hypothetical protein
MDQQQRDGSRLRGPDVQEVDELAVDGGGELREAVEPPLPAPSVIATPPVLGQVLR